MIPIKTKADLEGMRAAARVAAEVRDELAELVRPGMTTGELSEFAAERMAYRGAKSAFKGYRGYKGNICVSVNEIVVHGLPGARKIELGDIISIDVGVVYRGYIGDTARTVMAGVTDPEVVRLVNVTREALAAGIARARAGRRVSDISHAIEKTAVKAGFSVVREFVGHGIGKRMHEEPQIPNFGAAGRGPLLKPGMTLAIEPMINMGEAEVEVLSDGWSVSTCDGRPSAHFEHTVAVCDGEAEILTL